MNIAKRPRIGIPSKYIPKQYIGEKFGVLLVFLKGDTDAEIEDKAKKVKAFCVEMKEANAI